MKDETTQGILTVARGVLADLDVAVVLERVLESARDVTAAGLYLTDKRGGEPFSQQDEGAVLLLAEFAGVAIDHARRYSGAENHRRELQQTVNALEATIQIARAPGGQTDLESILELVAKRGRALVSARALIVQLCDGPELKVAAGAGELPADLVGQRVHLEGTVASAALRSQRPQRPQRLTDELNQTRFAQYGWAISACTQRRPGRPADVSQRRLRGLDCRRSSRPEQLHARG